MFGRSLFTARNGQWILSTPINIAIETILDYTFSFPLYVRHWMDVRIQRETIPSGCVRWSPINRTTNTIWILTMMLAGSIGADKWEQKNQLI